MTEEEELYRLNAVSSLNFRTVKRGEKRESKDVIPFVCSVCGKRKILGKTASALLRLSYSLNGDEREIKMCGVCMDLMTDIARYGPRVVDIAYRWKRTSRVARISLVKESLFCFNCLGTASSHLFIKYDDLKKPGESAVYATKRICARCTISYIHMLMMSEDVRTRRFPELKVKY